MSKAAPAFAVAVIAFLTYSGGVAKGKAEAAKALREQAEAERPQKNETNVRPGAFSEHLVRRRVLGGAACEVQLPNSHRSRGHDGAAPMARR